MKIYIGGLWPRVTRKELERLIEKVIRRPWYVIGGSRLKMQSCSLLQMVEQGGGKAIEYGGVIDVSPTRLGWQIVEALNGMVVHGRTLKAHKWFPRTGLTCRRTLAPEGKEFHERRADRRHTKDRRRQLSVHDLTQPLVTRGVKGYERSYGR